jgi:plasmid replication initiation protein
MAELVVKDNALIQASYTLDTVEQRLILLAIAEARETGQGITENSLLEVHASSYINTFNVEKHTAYTVLRDASRSLFDRYVTYHDINPKTGKDRSFHCRWVDKIGYEHQSGLYSYVSLKILSL